MFDVEIIKRDVFLDIYVLNFLVFDYFFFERVRFIYEIIYNLFK